MRGFHGKYAALSNSRGLVLLDGEPYPSVWHAFAAYFQPNPEAKKMLRNTVSYGDALFLGRREIREQPEQVQLDVMARLLRLKFDLNDESRLLLLETGKWKLVAEEEPPGDKFWGETRGVGRNELGKLLMVLREEYRDG